MGRRAGALVVGANLRSLGIARSLGRRGIETWVVPQPGDHQVARASRYVRRTLAALTGTPAEKSSSLIAIAGRNGGERWALFPTGDESAAMVAQNHERLAAAFAPTSPDWDIYQYAYHKHLTYVLAERTGLELPWTRWPRSLEDVTELDCDFPVILKPDAKPLDNRFTHAKAWRVDDRSSLLAAWQDAVSLVGVDAVMVQELVPGSGDAQYSFCALCREGLPLASLVARRTRQYPRQFGHSSSLVETVHAPEVEERGRAVLEALRWNGLVEVEFKQDARDGSYKLLDINGRVWTWHGLGSLAGVDFPYLAWRFAQGRSVEPVRAKTGVRWVRLATDVPSALAAASSGELSMRAWAASLRGPRVGALFALDDPLPSLMDPALLLWRALAHPSLSSNVAVDDLKTAGPARQRRRQGWGMSIQATVSGRR